MLGGGQCYLVSIKESIFFQFVAVAKVIGKHVKCLTDNYFDNY